jgi:hypothetical protein
VDERQNVVPVTIKLIDENIQKNCYNTGFVSGVLYMTQKQRQHREKRYIRLCAYFVKLFIERYYQQSKMTTKMRKNICKS